MSPRVSPEEAAANRARLRQPPTGAAIVRVEQYATCDKTGHVIALGERAWRWIASGVGGPGGVTPEIARNGMAEYNWRCLEHGRDAGWKEEDDADDLLDDETDPRLEALVADRIEGLVAGTSRPTRQPPAGQVQDELAWDQVVATLRASYPSLDRDQVRDIERAILDGQERPHGIVGMFVERQLQDMGRVPERPVQGAVRRVGPKVTSAPRPTPVVRAAPGARSKPRRLQDHPNTPANEAWIDWMHAEHDWVPGAAELARDAYESAWRACLQAVEREAALGDSGNVEEAVMAICDRLRR